ncbi:MAG: DNA polymerase ligase N-terminal domain-containing protein [Halomonas sp.]|uniref:DNA polymerase ligase N-terminal domain-containing protein n=1 Tax=Halomonas sp. TaxID=1486246 RepID=UPI002ACE1086|nr:DNA polymerase ligase N-terminal domain-containing protein [Halomonas sp.]MDZ7851203.1 DNA polymerase ligase N-terminal domain-containing protein [Halomonas sp.]
MSDNDKGLAPYLSKRDFRKSPEPQGKGSHGGREHDNPLFVIQHHDASSEHYDFRLEIDGTLTSWAVPKGPSTDPAEKRLAVRVEDHPLDYADFEGVIPPNRYGAGTVLVWDAGLYRNLRNEEDGNSLSMKESLEKGQIKVWLEGRKLRGGYALIHSRMGGGEKNWLLIKMDDEGADARRKPTRTEPESVISGRTLDQIADQEAP